MTYLLLMIVMLLQLGHITSIGYGGLLLLVFCGLCVCALNSDLSCFLYRVRLKRPYLHCRADAVV